MADETEPEQTFFPAVRTVPIGAAFGWLAAGWNDFRAKPGPSLFYGACFAVMGWLIVLTFRHAYEYVSALVTGFFLVGPFFAIGLYDLSRRRSAARRRASGRATAAVRARDVATGRRGRSPGTARPGRSR